VLTARARKAAVLPDSSTFRQDFLNLEQRWLELARSIEFGEQPDGFAKDVPKPKSKPGQSSPSSSSPFQGDLARLQLKVCEGRNCTNRVAFGRIRSGKSPRRDRWLLPWPRIPDEDNAHKRPKARPPTMRYALRCAVCCCPSRRPPLAYSSAACSMERVYWWFGERSRLVATVRGSLT
jgi:hypothetical protein